MNGSFDADKKNRKGSVLTIDKESRFFAADTELISAGKYNLIIGLMIACGFALNLAMAYFMPGLILSLPPVAIIIAYFVLAIGGIAIVHRSSSAFVSGIAFFVLAAGTGLVLTYILSGYTGASVVLAFAITAVITVVMAVISSIFPAVFLSMGRGLLVSLGVTIVAELICMFFFRGALGAFDYVVILIFCGYIGFDWARAQLYQKTVRNAIASAADLYVDIVNILIRILSIVGKDR